MAAPLSGTGKTGSNVFRAGVLAALLISAAILFSIYMIIEPHRLVEKAYWHVTGPPCQIASEAELAQLSRTLDQSFNFEGVHFARISGGASCTEINDGWLLFPDRFDVCQFNSPHALIVIKGSRLYRYMTGDGRPATVKFKHDADPTCVISANFH